MTLSTFASLVGIIGTVVAVVGFVIGLMRHFGEVNEKNVREWQKVVVQKILQQASAANLTFDQIKLQYRSEAQAFQGGRLSKSDISEDALRRIMVELVSSGVAAQGPGDVYSLKVSLVSPDLAAEAQRRGILDNERLTNEALKYLKVNPYRNTLQELTTYLAQTTGIDPGRVEMFLLISFRQSAFVMDDHKRIALATEAL